MNVYEIVKLNRISLDVLQKSCMSMADCSYLDFYEEYVGMVRDGCKRSMVVDYLSRKYRISERRAYYLIKKFGQECRIGAVCFGGNEGK